MTMAPGARKFTLTVHVVSSIGWLGAVVTFLALAVVGLASSQPEMVRGAYMAMEVNYVVAVVPFGLVSLVSGIVASLGTRWGLFKHYWVLVKLLVTIPASFLMLVHVQPVSYLAGIAAKTTLASSDFAALRVQLVAYAVAATLILLTMTVLSVYKPRGRTRYGRRKQHERTERPAPRAASPLPTLQARCEVQLGVMLDRAS